MDGQFQISDLQAVRTERASSPSVEVWSNAGGSGLTAVQKAQSKEMNERGFLDLSTDDPLQIAMVDGKLNRQTGKLTFTELDGNAKHKKGETLTVDVQSGNGQYSIPYGQGADGRYDNLEGHGPIPKGEYLIGNRYKNDDISQEHPGGDAKWYKLYGKDGKGGYSYDKIWNGRGGFNFHTGNHSKGCVGVRSDVPEENEAYPTSTNYNQVKAFLDSTKPLIYKGSTFRGWLHVE